ncbi:MAG: hypothetical protein ABH874_03040 [Methanobacteriota archaeon]
MTATASKMSEKQMFALILRKLDRIETKLMEQHYPEEESIREEFVREVEAAEERVRRGNVKRYTPEQFKKEFSA